MKGYKSVTLQYTNSYSKFDVNILQDNREKWGELNLNKRKYLLCD